MGLKLDHVSESPVGLVKTQMAETPPALPDLCQSFSYGRFEPKFCISSNFPGDAPTGRSGNHTLRATGIINKSPSISGLIL